MVSDFKPNFFCSDPVPFQWETCSGRIKFAPRQKAELETLFQDKMPASRSEKEMLSKLFGVPKRKIEVFDLVFCSMTEKFIYLDFFNCRQDRVNLFSLHYYCCSLY